MSEDDKSHKISSELDDDLIAYLVITCEKTGHITKVKITDCHTGESILCPCGTKIVLKGEGVEETQDALDRLKRSLDNL